jgi:hypothetical protein
VTRLVGLWSSLVAAKRRPTPQQIVAAEAETSSGAFKKGIIIGALGLFQPTFALKLIIATEIFLDVSFQVFGLYPLLDRKFELLKAEQKQTTKRLEGPILQELKVIRETLQSERESRQSDKRKR